MSQAEVENVLQRTIDWFAEAVPAPTDKNLHVQLGAHFEEVAEMIEEILPRDDFTRRLLEDAQKAIDKLATHLKRNAEVITIINMRNMLDAVCDQHVTAAGVGYMLGLDVVGGLAEVNRSNWSKFIDGKAIFDENGKIKKGPGYSKPNLDPFV